MRNTNPARSRLRALLHEMWRSRIAILALLLLALMWAGIWRHNHAQLTAAFLAAKREQTNLANAFARQVEDSIQTIDHSLRLAQRFAENPHTFDHVVDWLPSAISRTDHLSRLVLIDAKGLLTNPAALGANYRFDVSDRDYFQTHKTAQQDRLFIGEPIRGRVTQRWAIPFTRRVESADGAFHGVVLIAVKPGYFAQFHTRLDLASKRINLIDSSGVELARGAAEGYSAGARHALKDRIIAAADGECFGATAPGERKSRLYCSRSVGGSPLYVVVSQPFSDIAGLGEAHPGYVAFGFLVSLLCAPLIVDCVIRRRKLDGALEETERARAVAAMSERELRYTLENMCGGIMLINHDGGIRVWNAIAFRLLGLAPPSPGETITNDALRRMLRENRAEPAFGDLLDLSGAMEMTDNGIACCAAPGGHILKVRTLAVSDGFVRKIEDITQPYLAEKRQAQDQERELAASRARAAFVARMTHEIRTPLHATIGFSRLLAREKLPAEAKDIASEIYASTSHLIAIIDDILDFSSIDAGQVPLKNGPMDIRSIIDQVVTFGRMLASGKPVLLVVDVSPHVPATLCGDAVRIKQVLTNLASNAVKFTERGEVRVSAGVEGGALALSVSDTGCGIHEADIAHIFEPFLRSQQAYGTPGSGLGLAIVRELVSRMGGSIDVRSAPDAGTTFRVRLSLAESLPPPLPMPIPPAPRGLRILVADDTRSSLRLIRLMLEAKGHCVATVENGAMAVEAFATEMFDLVLLDLQMPEMDGLAAAEMIVTHRRHIGCHTLVAALSAQVLPEARAAASKAGIEAFLTKPFEDADLDRLLRQASERAQRNARKANA